MHLKLFFGFVLVFLTSTSSASSAWKSPKYQSCFSESSAYYGVPEIVVKSIAKTEGGIEGSRVKNRNGSYDLGVMQINDRGPWFKRLLKLGFTKRDLIFDGCKSIWAGTYILANEIYEAKEFWRGVGNYHNRRNPFHETYLRKVKQNWLKIQKTI